MNAWREYATVGRGLPLRISNCVGNMTNPINCDTGNNILEIHTEDAGLRCQGEEDSLTKYQCTLRYPFIVGCLWGPVCS